MYIQPLLTAIFIPNFIQGCTISITSRYLRKSSGSTRRGSTVVSGLEIVEFPKEPITVELGNHATISCKVVGNPRPTVEWIFVSATQQNETKVVTQVDDPKAGRVIQHDGSLHFFKATLKDKGVYQCRAYIPDTDPVQEVKSESATLTVIQRKSALIEFADQPKDMAIATGNTVTLKCSTSGCPKKMTQLHWEYRSILSDPTVDRQKVITVRDDASSNKLILRDGSLVILNIQPEDEGTYYCVATCNPHEYVVTSRGAWLHLTDGNYPVFLEEPQNTTAVIGDPAIIKCRINPVYDQSSTQIEWYTVTFRKPEEEEDTEDYDCDWCNNRSPLQDSTLSDTPLTFQVETTLDRSDSKFSVLDDGSLYISEMSDNLTDDEFYCKVSRENQGKQTSNRATLTGTFKAVDVLVRPSDQTVKVGGAVTLYCQFDHDDESSLRWYKSKHGHIYTAFNNDDSQANFYNLYNGSLRITNIQIEDRGTYSCYAGHYGRNGIKSLYARVTVEGPDVPLAVGVSDWRSLEDLTLYNPSTFSDWRSLELRSFGDNARLNWDGTFDVEPLSWRGEFRGHLYYFRHSALEFFDDKLYFCGGCHYHEGQKKVVATKVCYVIGDYHGKFSITHMLEERMDFTLTRVGNKLVAIGGQTKTKSGGHILDTTEILEEGQNKEWRAGPNLILPRRSHCTVAYSDKEVIIIGGVTDENDPVPDGTLFFFDIETGRAEQYTGARLRTPSEHIACGLTTDAQLLVVAGDTFQGFDIRSLVDETHHLLDDFVGWYDLPLLPHSDYQGPSSMIVTPGVIWLQRVTMADNNQVDGYLKYEYHHQHNNSTDDHFTNKDDLTMGNWTGLVHNWGQQKLTIFTVLIPSHFRG